jgi:hypothetical protein
VTKRIQTHAKTTFVLLACFGIGVLATHNLLRLFITEAISKPSEAHDILQNKVEPSPSERTQPDVTSLVSISLPAPPAQANREQSAPAITKRLVSAEPMLSPKQAHLIDTQDVIDTQNEALIQQGFSLLNNPQQTVPKILISLPAELQQQENVINTLRACMGVTLGKVNGKGDVLAQENTGQPVSPFLRLVEGPLSLQEQQLAKQWQNFPGNIVRFYPESADAKVLGGLLQLVHGGLADKKITGEYRIQRGGLSLVNIKIDGIAQQAILRLAEQC